MADELTVRRLEERVRRRLGWKRPSDWPGELPVTELANEVGEWLVSMHDWHWLTRPPVFLSLVNGQEYVALPADFTQHLAIVSAVNSPYGIRIEDPVAVAHARARNLGPEASFVGCFSFGSPTLAGPKAAARLDIGPVPIVDQSQAFILAYKGGWTTVFDSASHIVVPAYVTALYVRACEVWVGGLEQESKGRLEDRLDRLVGSALWEAALARDDAMQQDLGRVRGGVGEVFGYEEGDPDIPRHFGTVPIVVNP